jgi:beta-N-acetylhexosaminidase
MRARFGTTCRRGDAMSMLASVLGAIAVMIMLASPAVAESLERMAGQMVLVGFQGDSTDDASIRTVASQIAEGTIGGVMFLKTNVRDFEHVKAINRLFMSAAGKSLPPLIAVDQEGGAVQRLTEAVGFPSTPSAADVAAKYNQAEAHDLYDKLASNLAKWGFNVNFGPVVDLNINKKNPIIAKYGRSYGDDGITVGTYAFAFIETHNDHGILTALKHFPGHGSSAKDSHEGFVDISKTWDESEFSTFRYIMKYGKGDFVMIGHLYNTNHSGPPDKTPASLSYFWITDQLRGKLGFNGVVITDDLEMAAVRKLFPLKDRVKQAVMAGIDILLFSNTANPRTSIGDEITAILVEAARQDPAFERRIEESYARIVELKRRLQ